MPFNANPPKPISAAKNDRQAQDERYSFLASKLYDLHSSGFGPIIPPATTTWLKTSPDRIYDQLRSSRILPAYPKPVDEATVKKLNNFLKRTLRWPVPLKISAKGLQSIVEGGSP